MSRFPRLVALLPLLALAGACGSSGEDRAATPAAEDELRALTASEVLGTLAYGETSAKVLYNAKPTYRAFRFQGTIGDQVEAWVRSADGNARGWITTSTFKSIASNDDASSGTSDAKLTATLAATGQYFVVFREKNGEDATLTVSLARTNGNAPPPITTSDPFSAGSCAGPALTGAQALAMLDVSRGVLEKKVGRFAIKRRSRSCYPGQPCSAWSDGGAEITGRFATTNGNFTTAEGENYYRLRTDGDVIVSYQNNAPRVRVRGDAFQSSWGASATLNYMTQSLELDTVAPGLVSNAALQIDYVWSPSLGCPNGHCAGNSNLPGKVPATWASVPVKVSGVMTSTCLRLAQSASEAKKDANANDFTLESDLVVAGAFTNASCHAKTCAEAAVTCGPIADGCGGTLSCGTCSNVQICEATKGPAYCRPQTSAEACNRVGRVLCPGSTDCWDACN